MFHTKLQHKFEVQSFGVAIKLDHEILKMVLPNTTMQSAGARKGDAPWARANSAPHPQRALLIMIDLLYVTHTIVMLQKERQVKIDRSSVLAIPSSSAALPLRHGAPLWEQHHLKRCFWSARTSRTPEVAQVWCYMREFLSDFGETILMIFRVTEGDR
jgi:hypothetical protein